MLHHMSTAITPPTLGRNDSEERVRLTISVSPEVHATFQRMAAATGTSLGRAMGDWLADTHEAAQFMTNAVERAREAPKLALRELHGILLGTAEETAQAITAMRRGVAGGVRAPRSGAHTTAAVPLPPSSNTGGKSPGRAKDKGQKP
jgi:hypothetical protein